LIDTEQIVVTGVTWGFIMKFIKENLKLVLLLVLVCSGWAVQTAIAAPPMLNFKLAGPETAQADEPLTGINARLINPGPATRDARLRLFIHDGTDHALQAGDIKVDVLEGNSWISLPLVPLKDGVMGAIGAEGSGHKDIHSSGGFIIPAKWDKLWQLRITFRWRGIYRLVGAVSPDNGSTHLAKPSSITVEAL
jgi:hypothetical protein